MNELNADSHPTTFVTKTIFAMKMINNEFVVEYDEAVVSDDCNNEELTQNLQNFRAVLDEIKVKRYDRNIISKLMDTQTKLVKYEQKRRIQELEKAMILLHHRLASYEYSLGLDGEVETSNDPATAIGNYHNNGHDLYICRYIRNIR